MGELKSMPLTMEVTVTHPTQEVDVEIHYRCFTDEKNALCPMAVSGTIHKNKTLAEFKQDGIDSYLGQGYQKVEIVAVFMDL